MDPDLLPCLVRSDREGADDWLMTGCRGRSRSRSHSSVSSHTYLSNPTHTYPHLPVHTHTLDSPSLGYASPGYGSVTQFQHISFSFYLLQVFHLFVWLLFLFPALRSPLLRPTAAPVSPSPERARPFYHITSPLHDFLCSPCLCPV